MKKMMIYAITVSLMLGIIIAFLTGFLINPLNNMTGGYFMGFPLTWLSRGVWPSGNAPLVIDWLNLFINIIIWVLIVFVILFIALRKKILKKEEH
jgi:disulfide bond formation protein DsbB